MSTRACKGTSLNAYTPTHPGIERAGAMTIKRRQVFYIAGFDHRGAVHYHEVYSTHAKLQGHRGGYDISVTEASPTGPNALTWRIDYRDSEGSCQTDYTYLVWDDITRREMKAIGWDFYKSSLVAFIGYLRSGYLKKTFAHAWPFAFSMVAAYCAVLLLPVALLVTAGMLALGTITWWSGAPLLLVLVLLLYWARQKLNALWLVHAFNFNARHAADESLLQQRLSEFARTIETALEADHHDEIMIVGHCYGSALLIPLLARLAPALAKRPDGRKISVVSLAQTSPLLSWLPAATWYREMMRAVDLSRITWVDYSSPADGVCFPKLDFFAQAGIAKPGLITLKSPRFFKLFEKSEYQRIIRKNKFRIHFQYLLSSRFTQEYDYFGMTAGHRSLSETVACSTAQTRTSSPHE